jgi:hypothetical protein
VHYSNAPPRIFGVSIAAPICRSPSPVLLQPVARYTSPRRPVVVCIVRPCPAAALYIKAAALSPFEQTEQNRTTNQQRALSPRPIVRISKLFAVFLLSGPLPVYSATWRIARGINSHPWKFILLFLSNVSILYYLCKSYEWNGPTFRLTNNNSA